MTRVYSYNGDKPYIFISYAHKDSDAVYPIIQRMQRDGYRTWFDEGIDPGTEWDETIAQSINNCGYFIAFVSKNYLGSNNCKDELNYARDISKKLLLVYLEEVKLTSGMAMRMNRIQSIFKYKYVDENEFYSKLYSSEGITEFTSGVTASESSETTVRQESAPATTSSSTATVKTIKFNNGSTYTGEVNAAGKMHGKGKLTWADGDVYEGDFVDDKRTGHGTLRLAIGNVYEGDFVDGKKHGKGK